jgi:hypothetical protein
MLALRKNGSLSGLADVVEGRTQLARVELYGAIDHLTAALKLSPAETANLIKEATGVDVNPDADDLLRNLNYAQLDALWVRLSELSR